MNPEQDAKTRQNYQENLFFKDCRHCACMEQQAVDSQMPDLKMMVCTLGDFLVLPTAVCDCFIETQTKQGEAA